MAWHDMKKVLEQNRRPEDILAARQANTLSRTLFPTGMSSNGAAMADERARMDRVLDAYAGFRALLLAESKMSEVRCNQLRAACDGLDDLMSDYSLGREAWEREIEGLRHG